MLSKTEGTAERRLLPSCVAIALALLGIGQCQAHGEGLTTTQGTTTTTLSLTRTITIQGSTPTALQSAEMQKGREYVLQGCYGQDGSSDVGAILDANATVRNATGEDGMSLSMCLNNLCKPPPSSDTKPGGEEGLSLFVGLSGGKTCYCGGSLSSTARKVQPAECTVPCDGDTKIACGGNGHMLIYKLSTPPGAENGQDDGPYADEKGSKGDPGVTAGIALGSISGFALLAFLIFYGARMHKRKQRQADKGGEHGPDVRDVDGRETPLATSAASAASSGWADRRDPRNSDPAVADHAPPGGAGWRPPKVVSQPRDVMAASTGADWRTTGGNPGTPRAAGAALPPKLATTDKNGVRDEGWDDIPDTPTILVQHPEGVAQTQGLGERAWRRRRLSAPMPPCGYRYSESTHAFGGGGPQGSQGTSPADSQGMPWEDGWRSLMPAPLALPPLGQRMGSPAGPAPAAEDGDPGACVKQN